MSIIAEERSHVHRRSIDTWSDDLPMILRDKPGKVCVFMKDAYDADW